MREKNEDFYYECDRYKRYLDGLMVQLVVKSFGGKYTKVYKELKEKFDRAYKKWEKMCDDAYIKQKLDSIGINIKPQRDVELYKEIQKKARKKKDDWKNKNLKEKPPNIKQAEKILMYGTATPRLRKILRQEIKDWKRENET